MLSRSQTGKHRLRHSVEQVRRAPRVRGALLALALLGTSTTVALTAPGADAASTASPSARVVSVAKKYVGHARYREGGASPKRGFDCSGYTKYVFGKAHVAKLPHNADGQRRSHKVHRISKKSRRAGDLIFYMSGGHAYHVAIYAGHGKQYAAATPRDGIRHQKIWSKHVRYGRVGH